MKNKLPLFYFSPTICWIDDDQLFLEAAHTTFSENYKCLLFNNPEKYLKFFTDYQSPLSKIHFTRAFTESDTFDTNNHYPVDIDINVIANMDNSPSIYEEITTIIVDYNMPDINGIEICHKFKDTPFKKILLTGQTCPSEVVDAFNNGLINKFIKKDHDASNNLKKYIDELTHQYFYDKTKNLLNHIEVPNPSPLSDQAFISFFIEWCQSNQIKEFYLINRQGSFRVKDKCGKSFIFIVMSEHEKNNFVKLNDDALDKIGNLLLELKESNRIPFFGIGKESWEFSYKEWERYFYPSNVIQGREKYYWTTISI